ncbi:MULTISPECIES: hypothetical protein [Clostridium]|uniref:hypothetical protein n=1 Tax=Clostridium TaxID=1485 RepID=UPI000823FD31|nr:MULTISPECIES: hypothetical protein [Clostridium]PJI07658.1 hypothetical protein CUB90_07180 [Clostridium sp. CT7]
MFINKIIKKILKKDTRTNNTSKYKFGCIKSEEDDRDYLYSVIQSLDKEHLQKYYKDVNYRVLINQMYKNM